MVRLQLDRDRFRPNPAWLTKAIATSYERMQREIPPAWLPELHDPRPHGAEEMSTLIEEYGCGAYGCVIPTLDQQVVMKVTTDSSEAEFVAMGMPWGWPTGITRYLGQMKLEGTFKLSNKRGADHPRHAWVLWREAATFVGKLDVLEPLAFESPEDFELRIAAFNLFDAAFKSGQRAMLLLHHHHDPGGLLAMARGLKDEARRRLSETHIVGGKAWAKLLKEAENASPVLDLAVSVEAYRISYDNLLASTAGGAVGDTLRFYFEDHQILLADLHMGNFGTVDRSGQSTWAITDPGNVMVLPDPW